MGRPLPSVPREALATAPNASGRAWSYATEPRGDAAQCPEQRVDNVLPKFVDWSIYSVLAVLLAAALISMCLFCYHPRFQNWVMCYVRRHQEGLIVNDDDDDNNDTDLLDLPPSPTLIDCPETVGICRTAAQSVVHIRNGRTRRCQNSLNGTKVISSVAREVDGSGGGSSPEMIFVMEDVS